MIRMRQFEMRKEELKYKRDLLKDSYYYMIKLRETDAKVNAHGNRILLEKYKKDYYYARQPWLRRIFHLGDLDPFDGYSSTGI